MCAIATNVPNGQVAEFTKNRGFRGRPVASGQNEEVSLRKATSNLNEAWGVFRVTFGYC